MKKIEAPVGPFPFFPWIPLCFDHFSQELWCHQICPADPGIPVASPQSLSTLGSTEVMAGFSFDAYTLIDRAQGVQIPDMTGGSPFSNGVWGCCDTGWPSHGLWFVCLRYGPVRGIKTSAAFVECRQGPNAMRNMESETSHHPCRACRNITHELERLFVLAQSRKGWLSLWLPKKGFQKVSDSSRFRNWIDGILHTFYTQYMFYMNIMNPPNISGNEHGFRFSMVRRCCYPPASFAMPSVASCAPAC